MFRRKKISVRELAEILQESLFELPEAERQKKTDWVVQLLEKSENDSSDPQARTFQRIRAELFRLGVKHSNQL